MAKRTSCLYFVPTWYQMILKIFETMECIGDDPSQGNPSYQCYRKCQRIGEVQHDTCHSISDKTKSQNRVREKGSHKPTPCRISICQTCQTRSLVNSKIFVKLEIFTKFEIFIKASIKIAICIGICIGTILLQRQCLLANNTAQGQRKEIRFQKHKYTPSCICTYSTLRYPKIILWQKIKSRTRQVPSTVCRQPS